MTFFAPPTRCALALALLVNGPWLPQYHLPLTFRNGISRKESEFIQGGVNQVSDLIHNVLQF